MTLNPFPHRSFSFKTIAQTDGQYADFAPYVPSINDAGVVAFQARHRQGFTGLFSGDQQAVSLIASSSSSNLFEVCSHPDLNNADTICFYALTNTGERGVFMLRNRSLTQLATDVGPLGPTMNERGDIAFRKAQGGVEFIVLFQNGVVRIIADTSSGSSAFHGLPVVNNSGAVVFRADRIDGRKGIYRDTHGHLATVIETGDTFSDLGSFPSQNDSGAIAFCGTRRNDRGVSLSMIAQSGIFVAHNDTLQTIIDTAASRFESFRGVLIDNAGRCVFYATPRGGTLGVYCGADPSRDCIVSIGQYLFGSTITDFALNPVSMNDAGQLALRIALADGSQRIVRADPV